jgi:hypothetical protein
LRWKNVRVLLRLCRIIGCVFRCAVFSTPAAAGVLAAASTQALAVALAGKRR